MTDLLPLKTPKRVYLFFYEMQMIPHLLTAPKGGSYKGYMEIFVERLTRKGVLEGIDIIDNNMRKKYPGMFTSDRPVLTSVTALDEIIYDS